MPFKTGVTEVVVTNGSLAPDAVTLARIGGPAAVVAIDQGGTLYGGGTAAGRRVMLPLGGDANSNWKYLNASGRLLVQRAIEWTISRAPTAPGYYEAHQPWSATQNDTWQTFDLSSLGVTPGAVAEVAITNLKDNAQLWAGIRAKGSGLDRRFHIHEAEEGGTDVVVMHVQTDGNGEIEHYADTASEIEFTLLGFWVGPTYVERFDSFDAGASSVWTSHDLDGYGVSDGTVAEVVMVDRSETANYEAGVRPLGSSLDRDTDLHEAEGGGIDAATMLVPASGANASVELWAQDDASIDFYLAGYWSVPPGTYTASADWEILPTSPSGSWTSWDLSGFGIPPGAVVQVALNNKEANVEADLGIRSTGSSLERRLDLHEAESGGDDVAMFHVNVDAASTIEWYDSNASNLHEFEILGWWVLPSP